MLKLTLFFSLCTSLILLLFHAQSVVTCWWEAHALDTWGIYPYSGATFSRQHLTYRIRFLITKFYLYILPVPHLHNYWKWMQNNIGADIIMALDDVVKTTITGPRIEEAMYRTLRWIDRCIAGKIINLANQTIELSSMKWGSSRTWIISLIALIWDKFNYVTKRTFEKQIVMYYPVLCMVS